MFVPVNLCSYCSRVSLALTVYFYCHCLISFYLSIPCYLLPSSASNRIIGAKDHASIQINISEVDKVTGRVNGQFKTYAICGAIRRMVGIFLKQNMIVFLFVLMGRFLGMLGPGK